MYTITREAQIDWKAVFKLGLRTNSILNSFLHFFSTFRQRLRATKIVTLNLWRVGRVKRQGRSAIRDHSGSYSVKIQSFLSKKQAVFGNNPQCRAPISGRRKVWSTEGTKQPLHSVRQPGHHQLGGHHQFWGAHNQLGGQLDDHLIATQPEQHCAIK